MPSLGRKERTYWQHAHPRGGALGMSSGSISGTVRRETEYGAEVRVSAQCAAAAFKGTAEGDFVGVLEVAAHWQP
jgi:hypothetical protein